MTDKADSRFAHSIAIRTRPGLGLRLGRGLRCSPLPFRRGVGFSFRFGRTLSFGVCRFEELNPLFDRSSPFRTVLGELSPRGRADSEDFKVKFHLSLESLHLPSPLPLPLNQFSIENLLWQATVGHTMDVPQPF